MGKERSATGFRRVLASDARANLAAILESVGEGGKRVLIERRGKPPVAVVSVDDVLQLELIEAQLRRKERAG